MASSKKRRQRQCWPANDGYRKKAVFGLSFIYMTRMLGLFMLMPVLAPDSYLCATVRLGLAVGIYGPMQALLQFPFW